MIYRRVESSVAGCVRHLVLSQSARSPAGHWLVASMDIGYGVGREQLAQYLRLLRRGLREGERHVARLH